MSKLAFQIKEKLPEAESIAELVLPVFREIAYLNAAEYRSIQEQITRLEVQPEDIRRKNKKQIRW